MGGLDNFLCVMTLYHKIQCDDIVTYAFVGGYGSRPQQQTLGMMMTAGWRDVFKVCHFLSNPTCCMHWACPPHYIYSYCIGTIMALCTLTPLIQLLYQQEHFSLCHGHYYFRVYLFIILLWVHNIENSKERNFSPATWVTRAGEQNVESPPTPPTPV